MLLDECHERHLDADLLLALLLDARAGLRPDLRLLATSATVATDRLAELLGGGTPVIRAHVRTFPVDRRLHAAGPRASGSRPRVARAVRTALSESDGDVLAFLPGAGGDRRAPRALLAGVDVVPAARPAARGASRTRRCARAPARGWCSPPRSPSPA